jgi:serine protease
MWWWHSGLPEAALEMFLNVVPGYDFISDAELSLDGDERDVDATDPGDYGPDCPMSSWHCTRVASILAARHGYEGNVGMKGVALNCTVMPVRVLGECKTGYASDVADAIVWAAGGEIMDVYYTETPAKIIMMAFSGYGACPGYLQSAVTQATNLGAIMIAAAGNNAQDAPCILILPW